MEESRKPTSVNKVFWVILFSYIFIIALSVVMAGYIYFQQKAADQELRSTQELERSRLLRSRIDKEFAEVVNDLRIMRNHHDLDEFIEDPTEENREHITRELETFVRHRQLYDQVRFLDDTGQEVIRINLMDGDAFVVADDDLQSKGKRYYFEDTFSLDEGEIFVSSFDLNVEQGKIEQPLKPMIRVGMPVTYDGEKVGILLINYLGEELLDIATGLESEHVEISFLNHEGYWLKGSGEFEWGFMYEDKLDENLGKKDPELWASIHDQDELAFYSKERGGLYVAVAIRPFINIQATSTGTHEPFSPSLSQLDPEEYHWHIVTFVPDEVVFANSTSVGEVLIAIVIIWIITLGIMALIIFRAIRARIIAQTKVIKLNDVLRIITKTLRHDLANVFAGIRGLLDLYGEKGNKEHLTTADAQCARGVNIITQMRQLEKTALAGKDRQDYRLRKVVQDTAKGYKIKVTMRGNGVVKADEAIEAVFNNIIGNAIRHGRAREIRIIVKKAKDNMLEIRIENNGKIIPRESIDKIFDEGFKLGDAGGTGIGLYIVRQTIERYGGTIYAENLKDPRGVAFVIKMPGRTAR